MIVWRSRKHGRHLPWRGFRRHRPGSCSNRLDQAQKLFALFAKLDRDYLERRIRYETAGEYGVESLG